MLGPFGLTVFVRTPVCFLTRPAGTFLQVDPMILGQPILSPLVDCFNQLVVVLHHVSENDSKPRYPASRKALMGKVSQLPELILTVALDGDQFHIAAVKNRDGVSDPTAESYAVSSIVLRPMLDVAA